MMKLKVAIFPPKHVQDVANSYRKRYDSQYAHIAPHITVKDIFDIEENNLPSIIQALQEVADKSDHFELVLHKVGTFHPTNNVLYFAIQDEEPLHNLHKSLFESEVLYQDEAYSYVPHLTIGQDIVDGELHDVYGRMRMKSIDFSFPVEKFHLLYQLDNGSWTTYETFALQKK